MFSSDRYSIRRVSRSGDEYEVYESGERIMRSSADKLADGEIRFHDDKGDPVLRVTAEQLLNVASSYSVVDERDGEVIGGLKKRWNLLSHRWELLDSDDRVLGVVEEKRLPVTFLHRSLSSLLPFSYTISSHTGKEIGSIEGGLSLHDAYELDLSRDESGQVDRRLGIAASVVINHVEKS